MSLEGANGAVRALTSDLALRESFGTLTVCKPLGFLFVCFFFFWNQIWRRRFPRGCDEQNSSLSLCVWPSVRRRGGRGRGGGEVEEKAVGISRYAAASSFSSSPPPPPLPPLLPAGSPRVTGIMRESRFTKLLPIISTLPQFHLQVKLQKPLMIRRQS